MKKIIVCITLVVSLLLGAQEFNPFKWINEKYVVKNYVLKSATDKRADCKLEKDRFACLDPKFIKVLLVWDPEDKASVCRSIWDCRKVYWQDTKNKQKFITAICSESCEGGMLAMEDEPVVRYLTMTPENYDKANQYD